MKKQSESSFPQDFFIIIKVNVKRGKWKKGTKSSIMKNEFGKINEFIVEPFC